MDAGQDVSRILGISARALDLARTPNATPYLARVGSPCPVSLRPAQSASLIEAYHHGRLACLAGVGTGKTYIALLLGIAWRAKVLVIFTKARNVASMIEEYKYLRQYFPIGAVYVKSYDMLSRPKSTALLSSLVRDFGADGIVFAFDEAHSLANPTSARTLRVVRFFREYPQIKAACLSGTLTQKSILELDIVFRLCLKDYSPLPFNRTLLKQWANVLDADGKPTKDDLRSVIPLIEWAGQVLGPNEPPKSIITKARIAWQKRLEQTPGVVITTDLDVSASLEIDTLNADVPKNVKDVMTGAMETDCAPDGTPFASDMDSIRVLTQLSQGFYYVWEWPNNTPDKQWLEARSSWFRHIRAELKAHAAEGYDSPSWVEATVKRELHNNSRLASDLGGKHHAYAEWCKQRHKPQPPTRTVWLSDFFLDALLGATEDFTRAGILLWTFADAVRERFIELARVGHRTQIERLGHCPLIQVVLPNQTPPKFPQAKITVLSRGHGIGHNLQYGWAHGIMSIPTPSGAYTEQLLGRMHRSGQSRDTVSVRTFTHTQVLKDALRKAIRRARYIEAMTKNPQRLLMADWREAAWCNFARHSADSEKEIEDSDNDS